MDVGVDHVQGEPEGFPELSKALPEGISLFLMSFLDVFSFFFRFPRAQTCTIKLTFNEVVFILYGLFIHFLMVESCQASHF